MGLRCRTQELAGASGHGAAAATAKVAPSRSRRAAKADPARQAKQRAAGKPTVQDPPSIARRRPRRRGDFGILKLF